MAIFRSTPATPAPPLVNSAPPPIIPGTTPLRTLSLAGTGLLITLTVALVGEVGIRYEHPAALSDILAELKRYGKAKSSSVVVSERRNAAGKPEMVLVGEDEVEGD